MINHRIQICLLAALALAVIATGCGGADGAATSLTKPEFIKAADAICKEADQAQEAELQAYIKDNPNAESTKVGQVKLVAAAGLPAVGIEIEELKELEAPSGDEAEIEAIVQGMEEAFAESESTPSKVLTSAGNPFSEVEDLASKYGFKECDSPL